MAYSPKQIEESFNKIIKHIEEGNSLRAALSLIDTPCKNTFFKWLEEDDDKMNQYARACEDRADVIFEQIISIADESDRDIKTVDGGKEVIDNEVVQRSRLKIDARKWMLSKMNPKKYGDRVENVLTGEITTKEKFDLSKLTTEELLAYKELYGKLSTDK